MTDAERKLLELAVAGPNGRSDASQAWREARLAVIRERIGPEVREKYAGLWKAYFAAMDALNAMRDELAFEVLDGWDDELGAEARATKERGE